MSSRWPVLRDFQCYSRFRNISAQTRQLEVSQVSPRVVEKDQHRPLVMMQLSAVLGQSRAGLCVSDRFLVLVYSLNALVMIRWLIISIWQLESKWLHSMRMLRVILGWLRTGDVDISSSVLDEWMNHRPWELWNVPSFHFSVEFNMLCFYMVCRRKTNISSVL